MNNANNFYNIYLSMAESAKERKEEVTTRELQSLVLKYGAKSGKGGIYTFPDNSKVKLKSNKVRIK